MSLYQNLEVLEGVTPFTLPIVLRVDESISWRGPMTLASVESSRRP